MRKSFIIKFFSGLINLASSLIVAVISFNSDDSLGKGDFCPLIFWTISLSAGVAVSGGTILNLFTSKKPPFRILFIFIVSALISLGWIYCVFLIIGGWIHAFNFPIFPIWIIGCMVQLALLDLYLPKPDEKQNFWKTIVGLLALPFVSILSAIIIFASSFLLKFVAMPQKETYLIPLNFEGRFRVVYGEKCGSDIEYEYGRSIMKIPEEDRILIVQPELKNGWVDNEYFLVDADGNRTKLNEIFDFKDRLTKAPCVLLNASGAMGGEMSDESSSSDSPLAIRYTDFTVFNRDTVALDDRQYTLMERRMDSLTTALVNDCRKEIGNQK